MNYLQNKLKAMMSAGFWVYKTGNLYDMLSNTSPSPFVASGVQYTSFSKMGSPWQAFDNDDGKDYGADLVDSGKYVEATLMFNQDIKVGDLYYNCYLALGKSGTMTISLYINSAWVVIKNTGVTGYPVATIDVQSTAYADSIVRGVRLRITGSNARDVYLREIQITKWYQKGS